MTGFKVVFGVWLKRISFSLDWSGSIVKTVTGTLYSWERARISKLPPHSPSWIFFKNLCHLSSFWSSAFFTVVSIALSSGCKTPWSGSSGRHRKSLYDIPSEVFGFDSRYLTSCLLSSLGLSGSPWIWRFRMKVWYRQSPSPGTSSTRRSLWLDLLNNVSSFLNSSSRLFCFCRIWWKKSLNQF